jgi:hypothetical protein
MLPIELREMVYLWSFQSLPDISVPLLKGWGGANTRTPVLPPVCYVNRLVLSESLPAILASCGKAIVAHGYCGKTALGTFLARVPNKRAAQSVQELHLIWDYSFALSDYSSNLDLPFACQGLRTLSIDVEVRECIKLDDPIVLDNGVLKYSIKTAPEVMRYFKLRQVFELPMLRSLTFQCCGETYRVQKMGCKPADIFANLVSLASAEANKKSADFELLFKFDFGSPRAWSIRGSCRWA